MKQNPNVGCGEFSRGITELLRFEHLNCRVTGES